MRYEFHVGDYVKTIEGITGYVTRSDLIRVDGVPRLYDLQVTLPGFVHPITYSMHDEGVSDFFVRIGQYEFTKVDRIEPLPDNNGPMYPNSLMWKKINELVESVNELRAAQKGC